jgi:hypothetical protein
MSRSTSLTLRQAINAEETSEVFLILLDVYHADIGPPTTLRFVNNYTDIVSNGNTYIAYPFQITIPSDLEDALPRVQLTIDNVDRSIMQEIRSLTSAPDISISVILASDPDTIEAGPFETKLRNVDYDASTITGDLQSDDILNEPYPGVAFTPGNFPGLFT